MSEPKKRFKLSPELSDGEHWTLADDVEVLVEHVRDWAREAEESSPPGESFSVELVELTDEEVEALPQV